MRFTHDGSVANLEALRHRRLVLPSVLAWLKLALLLHALFLCMQRREDSVNKTQTSIPALL